MFNQHEHKIKNKSFCNLCDDRGSGYADFVITIFIFHSAITCTLTDDIQINIKYIMKYINILNDFYQDRWTLVF